MAEWRLVRSWTDDEKRDRLQALASRDRNFDEDPDALPTAGWSTYASESVVAKCHPGSPEDGGPFERGRKALADYAFSDTAIVQGFFDDDAELLGRPMLLEVKAFRVLRFLSGVVVGAVRSDRDARESVFGFRYDTLEGHIERGVEWFLLRKTHDTGVIRFRIDAVWRPGEFPNSWSRLGFGVVGPWYQKRWHARAHEIMAAIVQGADPSARPDILFERTRAHAR